LAQNKELKNQLTEMQEGFVKLSQENCKLVNQVRVGTWAEFVHLGIEHDLL
jgi:hypothetical protein